MKQPYPQIQTITIEKFYVVGIAIRTQNISGKAEIDIPQLWSKFMQENILQQIPNKANNTLYCIYTDYEGDYTQPYTTILGCKTLTLESIPQGMIGITLNTGTYKQFTAKGKIHDGIVFGQWIKIWQSDLDRSYRHDFEMYPEGMDYEHAEVPIFVGINNEE